MLVSFYVQGGQCLSCLSVYPGICRACKGRKKIPLSQIRSLFFPLSLYLSPSISFPFLFPFPFPSFLPPPLSPSEYVMEKGIRIYASHSKAGGRESAYIYPLTIRNISRFRIHVLSHSCLFYGSKKERERRDAQDIMIKNAGANPSLSVCAPDRTRTYTSQDTRS